MITATQARETTNNAKVSDDIQIIEKYITWASERGNQFTTAKLDDNSIDLLKECGYVIEKVSGSINDYFIRW